MRTGYADVIRAFRLPTLGIAARQASHATIHRDDRRRAALVAQLRAFRKFVVGKRIALFLALFKLGTLLFEQLFLRFIKAWLGQHSDRDQVLFYYITDLGYY